MKRSSSFSRSSHQRRTPWRTVRGGVSSPQGYLAAGVACGIKRKGLDLAVVFSSQPAAGAAVFTRNRVQAAPVTLSRAHLKASGGRARAVLLNSGCANACTGRKGVSDARLTAQELASHLSIEVQQVVVASTGVIGDPLPVTAVLKGIGSAVSVMSSKGGAAAARAIMTTDTREKSCALESRVGAGRIRIGGMAKGSGMIQPDMATMLSVITTDARISPARLGPIFRRVVGRTFNCLSVDGETSTNDMVLVLANGASGIALEGPLVEHFERGLQKICETLVRSIAEDGEGATKLIEVDVSSARTFEEARRVAKSIANSPLVKTAIYGEEPNWGRVLCAAGYSGVAFDPDAASLAIGGVAVFRRGAPLPAARTLAERALRRRNVRIHLDLGCGRKEARVWSCDLSHGYIDINGSYIS